VTAVAIVGNSCQSTLAKMGEPKHYIRPFIDFRRKQAIYISNITPTGDLHTSFLQRSDRNSAGVKKTKKDKRSQALA
jgi:hypothetical protein